MKKITLASASPRRQELLKQIGLEFEVMTPTVDEAISEGTPPDAAVCELAYRKAGEIAGLIREGLVIGADTVVVHKGQILGKPSCTRDAVQMLRDLSGSDHLVITGFCVIDCTSGRITKASDTTRVFFRRLTEDEIEAYVNSGEPMDKAGSYGIQGLGAILVDSIVGCYFNVVGLPLTKVALTLQEYGVKILG